MTEHKVKVDKNIVIVDVGLLATFFERNKNTIRGWKNSKNMPVYETDDRGVNFYNLLEVYDWKKINISEKFNHNKTSEVDENFEDDFKLELPYGLEMANINLDNSLHLSILAAHPMGQLIRETLEFKSKQKEKEKELEKRQFDLDVKKGKYIEIQELNKALVETLSLLKEQDVNMRTTLPIAIVDYLILEKIIKPQDKSKLIEEIIKEIDEVISEKQKTIYEQFMKYTKSTKKRVVDFLKELIGLYE